MRTLFEINPGDIIDDGPDPYHDPEFPAYLYTDSRLDKWQYVFNQTVLKQAVAMPSPPPS
ncbi:MAG: hypothetical protein RL268_760, partial [Pseudomonadota bacterium]